MGKTDIDRDIPGRCNILDVGYIDVLYKVAIMNLENAAYWKSLINMSLSKFFILQTLHRVRHGYALLRNASFYAGLLHPYLRHNLPHIERSGQRRIRNSESGNQR